MLGRNCCSVSVTCLEWDESVCLICVLLSFKIICEVKCSKYLHVDLGKIIDFLDALAEKGFF